MPVVPLEVKADCAWMELPPLICIAIVGIVLKTVLPSLHSPVLLFLGQSGGMDGQLLSRYHL